MKAHQYDIIARAKPRTTSVSGAADFTLGPAQEVDATIVTKDAAFSFYCFDFEREVGLFVELPPDYDLSKAAFVYNAQFDQARSVVAVSFGTMFALARGLPLPENLVVLHSTGRCGSTLASRILTRVSNVWSISEPDALTNLVLQSEHISTSDMPRLIDAAIRFICIPATLAGVETVVIKPRSEQVFLIGAMAQALPEIRNVFMYRDVVGYVNSLFRMIQRVAGDPDVLTNDALRDDIWFFSTANGTVRAAEDFKRTRPEGLDNLELIVMGWLLRMRAYQDAVAAGVSVAPLEYEALNKNRRIETERLLGACGLDAGQADLAMAAFDQDAHAGSQTGNAGAAQDLSADQRDRVAALVREWSDLDLA